jgi:hypothetical protein
MLVVAHMVWWNVACVAGVPWQLFHVLIKPTQKSSLILPALEILLGMGMAVAWAMLHKLVAAARREWLPRASAVTTYPSNHSCLLVQVVRRLIA